MNSDMSQFSTLQVENTLRAWQNDVDELKTKLATAESFVRDLKDELLRRAAKYPVGTKVYAHDAKGNVRKMEVRSHARMSEGNVMSLLMPIKKDGTAAAVAGVYRWESNMALHASAFVQ